jgi:hypothetical protein
MPDAVDGDVTSPIGKYSFAVILNIREALEGRRTDRVIAG